MVMARPKSAYLLCLGCGRGGRGLFGDEIGLVVQHPVQNDREFASQGNLGLAWTGTLRDAQRPGFQI